jgi:hypothetical protein
MEISTRSNETKLKNLRRFNSIMGVLHLIQGIVMLIISNDSTYPIYTNFLIFDIESFSLIPEPNLWYELPFGTAVAIFLFLSSFAHFALATFGYKWYVSSLKKGRNPVRFYEYAISSSWMIVLIGILVGIRDLGSIILIFSLNAMMNLFGVVMEYHNQHTKKTNWISFIFGSIAGIIPWILIVMYFVSIITSTGAEPPGFVYVIIPTIFLFFNSFAINMVLQYKKVGPWKDYLFGEKVYIVLSLLAKTALAWQIYAGTLAPV